MFDHARRPRPLRLEQRLTDAAPRVSYPATPDLASAVSAQLARDAATRALPVRGSGPRSGRWAAAAAGFGGLVVVAALLALVPAARTTVADALGVAGVRLFFLPADPTVRPSPVGGDLRLGRPMTLPDVEAAAAYPIHVPSRADLVDPDEVYLSSITKEGMVSFVYRPRPGLPPTRHPGVGALLTQFPGRTEQPVATKGIGPSASVEAVSVGGGRGFWIEGEAHVFVFRDPAGEVRYEEYRLAGNVLLWERAGLTFRLESALGKADALAIAESVREHR